MNDTHASLRAGTPASRCLLTVWSSRPGDFSARAVFEDGTLRDFDSPFELVRFLSHPALPAGPAPGLR